MGHRPACGVSCWSDARDRQARLEELPGWFWAKWRKLGRATRRRCLDEARHTGARRLLNPAGLPITHRVFGLCRYCGDELPRARRPLEVCAKCENDPLCDRCGHKRSDHRQVLVRGESTCNKRLGDFQTGMSWPCECEGFQPVKGLLSDATFASASVSPRVDPLSVRLRLAHPD